MTKFHVIAVVGSRDGWEYEHVARVLDTLFMTTYNHERVRMISGGACGVDTFAEQYAQFYGVEFQVFKPNWDRWGKSAGYIRNSEVVDAADIVVAFWDGKSAGTAHTINTARINGKTVMVHYPDGTATGYN